MPESRIFEAAKSIVATAVETADTVRATPIDDKPILSDEDKAKLPNADILAELNAIQATLARRLRRAADYIMFAGDTTTAGIDRDQ